MRCVYFKPHYQGTSDEPMNSDRSFFVVVAL